MGTAHGQVGNKSHHLRGGWVVLLGILESKIGVPKLESQLRLQFSCLATAHPGWQQVAQELGGATYLGGQDLSSRLLKDFSLSFFVSLIF